MVDDAGGWNVTETPSPHLSPTAGVLSAGGAATVYGRVYLRPTPQIVPADLADFLDPVNDASGQLIDWRLNPAKLAGAGPASVSAAHRLFTRWRDGYVTERSLGDLATIRSFLSWAEPRTEVSSLRALTSPHVRIDPATATRVVRELAAAGAACRASDQNGLGLAAPTRPGLVRGFVVTDQPLVVLASGTTQLTASTSGLRLTQAPARPSFTAAVVAPAPEQSWTLQVTGWSVEADGVVAYTDTGHVSLGDTTSGKLLAHTTPGTQHVRTYMVPLTSVFAALLTELPTLATLAARNAKALVLTH